MLCSPTSFVFGRCLMTVAGVARTLKVGRIKEVSVGAVMFGARGQRKAMNVAAVSPAEASGFQKGDLISSIEDDEISSLTELRKTLNRSRPRTKRFRIVRGSQSVVLHLPSAENWIAHRHSENAFSNQPYKRRRRVATCSDVWAT